MKRLISILSALVLVFSLSSSAFAQTDLNVNANAEVVAALSLTEHQEVDFAYINDNWSGGDEPTIDPSDGSTSGAGFEDATDALAGLLEVDGTGNQTVDITVATSITLGNGTDDITFTPSYNWSEDNVTSGSPSNPELGTNATNNFSMILDSDDGINTIFIGGQLEAPGSALSEGTYTGDATITISYQ